MLAGDNERAGRAVAASVGIDEERAEVLPDPKSDAVHRLRHELGTVVMVGDGINDAPALARADIGFAMGTVGTDVVLEAAVVALMREDLRAVPEFIHLSRRTAAMLKQNITISLTAKFVFFVLALVGVATLWMAVLADGGATLVVIANGLRVRRGKAGP